MIFGAVLAGGKGSRMGIDKPKQFLTLGEKPIIVHTIEKFLLCDRMEQLFVGVHPDWVDYTQDLINKYIKTDREIVLVPGGGDRNSTIFNIVEEIEKRHGESDEHIIVTHDSVRPFVTLRIINDNIDAALKYDACDTVVEAVDTIVVSEDGNIISEIPNRKKMFQGQTPQSFKMSLLKKLYYDLSEEEKSILTDACKICVVRDVPVKLVKGEVSNLKITTMSDLKMAKAMISQGGIEC